LEVGSLIVVDGGMGSLIIVVVFWLWMFEEVNFCVLEVVVFFYVSFINVGVDLIEMNFFGVNWCKLVGWFLEDDFEWINFVVVKLVWEVWEILGCDVFIVGSIGLIGELVFVWVWWDLFGE